MLNIYDVIGITLVSIPFIALLRLLIDDFKQWRENTKRIQLDNKMTRLRANLKSLNDNRKFVQNNKYNRSFTTYKVNGRIIDTNK